MKQNKASYGKLFFWLLLVIFVWIAVTYFAKTQQILTVLGSGKWYWIILAVLAQICYYPYYSLFTQHVFRIFRVELPVKNILPVYLASKFTDVALPLATIGQVAVFVRNGKKQEIEPLNAGISISFVLLFEVAALVTISLLTVSILAIFGQTRAFLLAVILFLTVVMLLVIFFLLRLAIRKIPPNNFFLWVIKMVARLFGQRKVELENIATIFTEIGNDLKAGSKKLWPAFRMALSTHLINILTFAFVYLAFDGGFHILPILAGYIAGLLFTVVSITPQGVGVAEAVMITTLHSFGVEISTAAVITLAFRGLLYWIPLFPGFYAFTHLELRTE